MQKILKKSQDVLNTVSNEMTLIQKNNELKETLRKKECDFNAVKAELQALTKEKLEFEIQVLCA